MLKQKAVVVADFGSSKINMLAGTASSPTNFNVLAKCQQEYSGFIGGKFVDMLEVKKAFTTCINIIQSGLNQKITKVFIGVPSEFCFLTTKRYNVDFKLNTKITERQLEVLFNQAIPDIQGMTLINFSPLNFIVDGRMHPFQPNEVLAKNLQATVSLVYAEKYFTDRLLTIAQSLNLEIEFICSALAQGNYLFDKPTRANGAVLIDCGFTTTCVSKCVGEGLAELKSFSLGGGHITGDFQEILNLPYSMAEELKRKLILTIQPSPLDTYELDVLQKAVEVSTKTANDIALARIDTISAAIKKCIDAFAQPLEQTHPIYITGGGLSYLKGIKAYLSKTLNRKVNIISPSPLQFSKPHLSSAISLLYLALQPVAD